MELGWGDFVRDMLILIRIPFSFHTRSSVPFAPAADWRQPFPVPRPPASP